MKKTLAIILTLVLAFSMAFTAFADATAATYTITINNATNGHTYEAYQIFTGDLTPNADGVDTLTNITWGSGVDTSKAGFPYSDTTAAAVAETLTNETQAKAFAENIANYLSTTKATSEDKGDTYTISSLAAGYYLVIDKDDTLNNANDSYTSYILEVVEDSAVSPKSSVPTVEKKVKDINDSTDTAKSEWQDSADHDIADVVDFQLTATLASNVSEYDVYKLIFHDTLSAGFTYGSISSVTIGGTSVAVSNCKVNSNGTALTFTIDDVISLVSEGTNLNGAKVVVEYTATLNENAVVGVAGNPNEVYLEYSNNPNQTQEGLAGGETMDTGKTATDKVIVFTYKAVIDKVKKDGSALAGAVFTLTKYDKDTDTWVTVTEKADEDATTFTYVGIDDGLYCLTENTPPSGYNSIDPIYFVVKGTHDTTSDDPKLTKLEAYKSDVTGTTVGDTLTTDITSGAAANVSFDVVNQAGSTLPETGGIGTTIFYIVGGMLMLAAVIIFVAKRKVGAED